MMQNKYKNTADLPISAIKEIIEESGYSYVLNLLGQDEDSIRLLVYLLVLIHQLKGTKLGIEIVLNLLKKGTTPLVLGVIGDPEFNQSSGYVYKFTVNDYIQYKGYTTDQEPFEITFQIRTPANFLVEQAIASASNYGFYLGINTEGKLVLCLGSNRISWDICNRAGSQNVLATDNNYYIKLVFDGYEYDVKVSEDGVKYTDWITVSSNATTDIHKGIIYLGVDGSKEPISKPFQGIMNLKPFSTNVSNAVITEWFEQFPVGAENTFIVKADLDLGVVSTDFFENFAIFVSKYVYPTLGAFEAKLNFQNNLTFLPYVRQRITYIANGDVAKRTKFLVKESPSSPVATLPFTVNRHGIQVDFEVLEDLYLFKYESNEICANDDVEPTQLYKLDGKIYSGAEWTLNVETGKIYYEGHEATYDGIYEG